jgi:hypothetical protein
MTFTLGLWEVLTLIGTVTATLYGRSAATSAS